MGFASNIKRLKDRWASVKLVDIVSDVAEDNEVRLADLNRQQLYEKGEDATGKKLRRYKSNKYARVKNEMNPKPGLGNPDFFVSGDFQKSIFAQTRGKSIVFDAADKKTEFLVKRDGEEIFGLQDESKKTAWKSIFKSPVTARINSITGSKFKT